MSLLLDFQFRDAGTVQNKYKCIKAIRQRPGLYEDNGSGYSGREKGKNDTWKYVVFTVKEKRAINNSVNFNKRVA